MIINDNLKKSESFSHTFQNKQTFNINNSFEEKLLNNEIDILSIEKHSSVNITKVQEERCLKVARNIKRREKMRAKVEKYLSKKIEEERRKIKIMIQVLNNISKNFPYMLFHSNRRNKI